jgi:hypothetical protein
LCVLPLFITVQEKSGQSTAIIGILGENRCFSSIYAGGYDD